MDNAEPGDPAYAAIGKYEDLHRLAVNGSQVFHSQRATQEAPVESQGELRAQKMTFSRF